MGRKKEEREGDVEDREREGEGEKGTNEGREGGKREK